MPFIFCSDAFPPWRYSFLLLEKSGSASLARLRNAMQNFSKEFSSSAPPSPLRKWLLSRLFTRQPFLTFLYLPFFFFFTTCYVIPRSNFPRFFPCPDFHGFLDIAGSTTFFFPSSSKMEGINTRHFNATSWPTFAK